MEAQNSKKSTFLTPLAYINASHPNFKSLNTIPIDDAEFTDICVFSDGAFTTRGFEFKNCVFKREVSFENISTENNFKHHFTFKECIFEQGIVFFRCNLNVVDIIQCVVKKRYLGLESSSISTFRASLLEGEKIYIHGGGKYNLISLGYWGPNKVKHLILECDGLDGDLYLSKSEVDDLEIIRLFPNGTININDSKLQSFLFSYFTNRGKINIRNIEPIKFESSYFTVYKSTLGDVQFVDIDFRKYSEFNVLSSDITELKFVKTIWHDKIDSKPGRYTPEFEERGKLPSSQTLIDRKEVYKQLRHSSSKQGDILSEGIFHEKEMNTYYEIISWRKHFWTKMILGTSRIFGNYGKNFRQPLIGIIIFHSVTLALMVLRGYDDFQMVKPSDGSWEDFGNFLSEFIRLLNPVHSFEKAKGLWIIPDTVIRIYTSFFIYNMLRATRRFVK
jgi:hypothetical protein